MAGKYYWLKLKKDFFKRHDVRIVEDMPQGKEYILFYLKLMCESVDHSGELRFSEEVPYTEEMLATITNTDIEIVKSALKIFSDLKMVDVTKENTYVIHKVKDMIGSASNTDNAKRQARYRERKKEQEDNASVTKSNAEVTVVTTENNESKSKSKNKSKNKKKNTKKKNEVEEIIGEQPSELQDHLRDFVKMRKDIKKPLTTERAMNMLLKKLYGLANGNMQKAQELLDEAILHNWQSVYEPQQKTNKPRNEVLEMLNNGVFND